jgi:hypothetical protein
MKAVSNIANKIPILLTFNEKNCFESFLDIADNFDAGVLYGLEFIYKPYMFRKFLEDQDSQIQFYNELNITKEAKLQNMRNVIHFEGCYLGINHLALKFTCL